MLYSVNDKCQAEGFGLKVKHLNFFYAGANQQDSIAVDVFLQNFTSCYV